MLHLRYFFLLLFVVYGTVFAQTPSACFEIETIFVDACGNPEPENEMVRFKTGPAPLAVANLNAAWPNGAFQGICQNVQTANVVAALNSTITGCGFILEPQGGMLPAGKTVMLVTSTLMSTTATSFAGLSDTIYMIFQCPGNSGGHFKNYQSGSGPRTLTMSFGASCSDVVTYVVDSLVDQNGQHAAQDGAYAGFSWSGVPTYGNTGCVAPVTLDSLLLTELHNGNCAGDTFTLSGTLGGNPLNGGIWSGGNGVFLNNGTSLAQYIPANESGNIVLTYTAPHPCGSGTLTDSLVLALDSLPDAVIGLSGPAALCTGDTLLLLPSPTTGILWSDGSAGSFLVVSTPGTYWLQVSNACGTDADTVTVLSGIMPAAAILPPANPVICGSDSVLLIATGGFNYLWSQGPANDSVFVSASGYYTVTVSNGCGSDTASVFIGAGIPPLALIAVNGSTALCTGDTAWLNASGSGSFLWLPSGLPAAQLPVDTPGTYTLVATTACGSDSTSVIISAGALPLASILSGGAPVICNGAPLMLSASGGNTYQWINGPATQNYTVSQAGTYSVIVSNTCGSDTADISLTNDVSPVADISVSGPLPLCLGEEVILTAPMGYQYQWSNGGSQSFTTAAGAGWYTLICSNVCGFDIDSVLISEDPVRAIAYTNSLIVASATDFTLTDSSVFAAQIYWQLPDGTQLSQPSVTGNFTEPGTYTYLLTAVSSAGCRDVDTVRIEITETPAVFIPNAFSPNGDNVNNSFRIRGTGVKALNGHIFNRWGELVFSFHNKTDSWDGDNAPQGVYVYYILIDFTDGSSKMYHGNLSLLR